jgi:hypothetical protein
MSLATHAFSESLSNVNSPRMSANELRKVCPFVLSDALLRSLWIVASVCHIESRLFYDNLLGDFYLVVYMRI